METLYVKTDGPVPEGMFVTAGKPYAVDSPPAGLRRVILNDRQSYQAICFPRCNHVNCLDWTFCDSTGNPVPAPWESKPTVKTVVDDFGEAFTVPAGIDYRAHAERLAQVLYSIRKECGCGHPACHMCRDAAEVDAALSAYNQATNSGK